MILPAYNKVMDMMEKSHKMLLLVLGAAAVLAVIGFGVFRPTRASDATPAAPPRENAASGAVPAIDVNQPTEIETATFALG
jgi:hypothetical protein